MVEGPRVDRTQYASKASPGPRGKMAATSLLSQCPPQLPTHTHDLWDHTLVTGFVKRYPNALGHSITSLGVASPQLQGKSVHFGPSPLWLPLYQMFWGIFLAAVLFCHYHHTVFKSKTHVFYFFLIFVYSSIILNTTNSSFPCLSWKKIPKYAPKWPAQHLNHHQITLRFSFKQYSLLGPVSCKKLK